MRVDSKVNSNDLHWHDGCTCHGTNTINKCIVYALAGQHIGKILEREDSYADGKKVRCYSIIISGFEHHAKFGKYVAETKIVADTL